MKRWSSRQVFALVLGGLLALGMSLSVVQAADMAAKMATAMFDMGTSSQDACDDCGDGDAAAMLGACLSVCTASAFAMLSPASRPDVAQASDLPFRGDLRPSARAFSPDPYPPRPIDLV